MNLPVILLVEDDPNDQELIRLCLAQTGIKHELITVPNGEEALNYLLNQRRPDLILLDLKTPKVGGIEVLKELKMKDLTNFLPLVVFTSSKEEKDIRESYENGAKAYIHKPIEFTELKKTIQCLATFWLGLNHTTISSSEA